MQVHPELQRTLEPMIADGYLSRTEEDRLMEQIPAWGLDTERARKQILSFCLQRKVTLERLAELHFRDLAQAVLRDHFLGSEEEQTLEQLGLQLFEHAPQSMAEVQRVIQQEMKRVGATSESELRQAQRQRLEQMQAGGALTLEQRRQQRDRELQTLGSAGINFQENDIGAVLDDIWLPPVTSHRRSPVWLMVMVAAVVAAAVVAIFLSLPPQNPSPKGMSVALQCGTECGERLETALRALQDALEEQQRTGRRNADLDELYEPLRRGCAPFWRLSDEGRLQAGTNPNWDWCRDPVLDALQRDAAP